MKPLKNDKYNRSSTIRVEKVLSYGTEGGGSYTIAGKQAIVVGALEASTNGGYINKNGTRVLTCTAGYGESNAAWGYWSAVKGDKFVIWAQYKSYLVVVTVSG